MGDDLCLPPTAEVYSINTLKLLPFSSLVDKARVASGYKIIIWHQSLGTK